MAKTLGAELSGNLRRASIVAAALEHFAEHGYDGASLSAIARAAGISQPGLLHHFRSKEVLLAEVLAERDRLALTATEIERVYEGSPFIRALEVADAMVVWNADHRELARLGHLGAAQHPPLAASWARERSRRFRQQIAGVVRLGILDGSVRPDADPEQVAAFILAGFAGFESQWLVDESFDMVAAMHGFTDLLRRDLLLPGATQAATR